MMKIELEKVRKGPFSFFFHLVFYSVISSTNCIFGQKKNLFFKEKKNSYEF